MKPFHILIATCFAVGANFHAYAGSADFTTGPVFTAFGPVAPMQEGWSLPADTQLSVAFDAAAASDNASINRTLESAARFVNMHARAGVDPKNIDVAVVIHGGAVNDLLAPPHYAKRMDGKINPNIAAIDDLTAQGIRIILCGQTAAYRDVTQDMLLPNIEMSISAMTAHAQLQGDGYTLNPF